MFFCTFLIVFSFVFSSSRGSFHNYCRRAEFWVNGKRTRKSTGIAVGATRAEQRASKQLAQQVADNMERVATGQTSYTQAADALRAVAQATGMITKMPTVREFLTDFQGQASPKTESNRRRAFKSFLTWMDEHSAFR